MRGKKELNTKEDNLPSDWKISVLILLGSFLLSFALQVLVPVFWARSVFAVAAMKAAEYYHGLILIVMVWNSIGRLIMGGWLFRSGFAVIFAIGITTLFVLPVPTVMAIAKYADSKQIMVQGTVTKITELDWGKGTEVEYQYVVNGRSYWDYLITKKLWEAPYKNKVRVSKPLKIKASGTIPSLHIVMEDWVQ